jgi:hypothetical protein
VNPKEWPKILGRRQAGDEQPGNIGLKLLIQFGKAIVGRKSVQDFPPRRERDLADLHAISGCQDDGVNGERPAVVQPAFH